MRENPWTLSRTTYTQIIPARGDSADIPEEYWTPVSRDARFERRLLQLVAKTLEAGPAPDTDTPEGFDPWTTQDR